MRGLPADHRHRAATWRALEASALDQAEAGVDDAERVAQFMRQRRQEFGFVPVRFAQRLFGLLRDVRISNLGPVWPALRDRACRPVGIWVSGLAGRWLSALFLVAAEVGLFLLLLQPAQAVGATVGASRAVCPPLHEHFDPSLPRLRDALGLIVVGAFGSSLISASIGISRVHNRDSTIFGITSGGLSTGLATPRACFLSPPSSLRGPSCCVSVRPGLALLNWVLC